MKELTEYRKNGFHWKVIFRVQDIAISESQYGYEVFRVQRHNGREIGGKWCDPAEFAPSNEQWGSLGWTYPKWDEAKTKADELIIALLEKTIAENAELKIPAA